MFAVSVVEFQENGTAWNLRDLDLPSALLTWHVGEGLTAVLNCSGNSVLAHPHCVLSCFFFSFVIWNNNKQKLSRVETVKTWWPILPVLPDTPGVSFYILKIMCWKEQLDFHHGNITQ